MKQISTIEYILKFVQILSNGRKHTKEEMCLQFAISERKFQRTISDLRESGFEIPRPKEGFYYIDREKSCSELQDLVYITNEELIILTQAIESIDSTNSLLRGLRKKLQTFIDVDLISETLIHPERCEIVKILGKAIKEKKQVVIQQYRSGHSKEIRDRKVEPISFSPEFLMLCAFDIEENCSKQYKIARMKGVQLLDKPYKYEEAHRKLQMDCFYISGDTPQNIRFTMSLIAYNLLLEEYPNSAKHITQENDKKWHFSGPVNSYLGVGRFLLGLPGETEVLGDRGLKEYIENAIMRYKGIKGK